MESLEPENPSVYGSSTFGSMAESDNDGNGNISLMSTGDFTVDNRSKLASNSPSLKNAHSQDSSWYSGKPKQYAMREMNLRFLTSEDDSETVPKQFLDDRILTSNFFSPSNTPVPNYENLGNMTQTLAMPSDKGNSSAKDRGGYWELLWCRFAGYQRHLKWMGVCFVVVFILAYLKYTDERIQKLASEIHRLERENRTACKYWTPHSHSDPYLRSEQMESGCFLNSGFWISVCSLSCACIVCYIIYTMWTIAESKRKSVFMVELTHQGDLCVGFQTRLDQFVRMMIPCVHYDKTRQEYVVPRDGSYFLNGCVLQHGDGEMDLHLSNSNLDRRWVGRTIGNCGFVNGSTVYGHLKAGTRIWVEVEAISGNPRVTFCTLEGFMV